MRHMGLIDTAMVTVFADAHFRLARVGISASQGAPTAEGYGCLYGIADTLKQLRCVVIVLGGLLELTHLFGEIAHAATPTRLPGDITGCDQKRFRLFEGNPSAIKLTVFDGQFREGDEGAPFGRG